MDLPQKVKDSVIWNFKWPLLDVLLKTSSTDYQSLPASYWRGPVLPEESLLGYRCFVQWLSVR